MVPLVKKSCGVLLERMGEFSELETSVDVTRSAQVVLPDSHNDLEFCAVCMQHSRWRRYWPLLLVDMWTSREERQTNSQMLPRPSLDVRKKGTRNFQLRPCLLVYVSS